MCEVGVAKIQYQNLETRNMPRFLLTLKNFTKVATLAASGGFFSMSSLYVVPIKIFV